MINEQEKLSRHVEMRPAFDKRHEDPSKNYGIHGVDVLMYVKGKNGAYQFQFSLPLYLPGSLSNNEGYQSNGEPIQFHKTFEGDIVAEVGGKIYPFGVDYHSTKPQYEGQGVRTDCKIIGVGNECYFDGSALAGTNMLGVLAKGGSDGVFEELEKLYFERLV